MDYYFLGAAAIVALVITFASGGALERADIARDCSTLGSFRFGASAYDCEKRP